MQSDLQDASWKMPATEVLRDGFFANIYFDDLHIVESQIISSTIYYLGEEAPHYLDWLDPYRNIYYIWFHVPYPPVIGGEEKPRSGSTMDAGWIAHILILGGMMLSFPPSSGTQQLHLMSDEYTCEETVSQLYSNCKFNAGFVEGHPVETLVLRLDHMTQKIS